MTMHMMNLNMNEYAFAHYDGFVEDIKNSITHDIITHYNMGRKHDTLSECDGISDLRYLISQYIDTDVENIFIINGADPAIELIVKSTSPEAINFYEPAYGLYQKLRDNYSLNYSENEIDIICNPNNPDGAEHDRKQIENLARNNKNKIFIIDETYMDYLTMVGNTGKTSVPLVDIFENIYVVRSFSKVFGLAGIRLGYIVTNKKNISTLLQNNHRNHRFLKYLFF